MLSWASYGNINHIGAGRTVVASGIPGCSTETIWAWRLLHAKDGDADVDGASSTRHLHSRSTCVMQGEYTSTLNDRKNPKKHHMVAITY